MVTIITIVSMVKFVTVGSMVKFVTIFGMVKYVTIVCERLNMVKYITIVCMVKSLTIVSKYCYTFTQTNYCYIFNHTHNTLHNLSRTIVTDSTIYKYIRNWLLRWDTGDEKNPVWHIL